MRLHSLTVQAFGPFAGTETIDFDELSRDGLFLLHGRTGAGKTSVLDAVCFALYGGVPGARSGSAPDLRSHHASPELPPKVVLDLTAGGRRLRIERSPAWTRPKKRGGGTTSEQARTLLSEHGTGATDADTDGWRGLSHRNDEAAQLVTDALGMGLDQFATVVLLPQGEFATFLRSGANERRALLQRLFATDRFERTERWLVAERNRTAAALERASSQLSAALERAEHLARDGVRPLDAADALEGVPDPTHPPDPPQVLGRVQVLARLSAEAALAAEVRRAAAAATAQQAVRAHHDAEATARRAQRAGELREGQRRLAEEAPAVAAQRTELAAATAAHGVAGHLTAAAGALTAAERAGARSATAAAALAEVAAADGVPAETPPDLPGGSAELRERAAEHRREQGRISELVSLEAEVRARETQARAVTGEQERLRCERDELRERRRRAAQELTQLRVTIDQQARAAAGADPAAAALESAVQALAHARRADALTARRPSAAQEALAAADAARQARSGWLDARQARLDGVAAELAARLRAGSPCPVCGCQEHPAPAGDGTGGSTDSTGPDAPSAVATTTRAVAEEEAGQLTWERAEAAGREARERAADLERDLATARARAGGLTGNHAAQAVTAARDADAAARSAVIALAATRAELAALEAAEATDAEGQLAVDEALARLVERTEQLSSGLLRDRARLDAAQGGQGGLTARSARLAAMAGAAEALAAALDAEAAAHGAAQRAAHDAWQAASAAGFPDPATAQAAVRSAAEREHLAAAVAAHERARAAVSAQLDDLGAAGNDSDEPVPGAETVLEEASQARRHAEAAAEDAVRAAERATAAARSLERVEAEVRARVATTEPLARQAELAGELARCAEGSGGGNTRRMKLSTYVLAARLEQVAVAATERLEVMSDGRYRLVHTDALERRGAASGLGLRVLDAWTGVERDVATLSGGETFMASLSLALGLADVVRAEGGGSPVETLFVDEGFGTLDPESLEEVMGVLEQLRAGGRAVGLVSHVPELRTRVPARLEVQRTPAGSRLRTVLA